MLYTYVLKIAYVRHFKTKAERQCVIRCCHDGHIEPSACVCMLTLLKRNIYIRPLSFVHNKLRFILHEPYDLSCPLSGRSLGKTCIIALRRSTLLKEKNKSTTLSNSVFYLGRLIRSLSYIIIVPTLK